MEVLGITGGVITIVGGIVGLIASFMTIRRDRYAAGLAPVAPPPLRRTSPPADVAKPVAGPVVQVRSPTNMPWALASILLCWPAAIPAITYARRARDANAHGDTAAAAHAYAVSRRWTIGATVYFVLYLAIFIGVAAAQS